MTVALWIGGALVAAGAAAVAIALERENVARRNYTIARAAVPVARSIWLRALLRAVQALTLAAIVLACLWLASTGRP